MKTVKTFIFLLLLFNNIFSKILIIVPVFNRPDFIELQHKTFQKFLKDDYELVIFSDAKTDDMHQQLEAVCDQYSIKCIRVPQEIHENLILEGPSIGILPNPQGPSARHSRVVQYSFDMLGVNHDDLIFFFDSDIFLVRPFSLRKFLGKNYAISMQKKCYFSPLHDCKKDHPWVEQFYFYWLAFALFDMSKFRDKETMKFFSGYVFDVACDSGGHFAYYLKNHPEVCTKWISVQPLKHLICEKCKNKITLEHGCTHNSAKLKQIGLDDRQIKLAQSMPLYGNSWGRHIEFILNGTFVHYVAASNYQKLETAFINKKSEALRNYFNKLLS